MEHTSSEKISEALKLLEDAAAQKRDELKSVMSDKYSHLRNFVVENETRLMKTLTNAKDNAVDAASHAKDVTVEKSREIASDVDKSVHRSPWAYIGGAAVVSLLLGYVLGRNRD